MGILSRLASGEGKYRPIEPPILGRAPSYASLQAVPDRATSGLVNNIQEVLQDAAGQQVAGSAVAYARTFLSNQGIKFSDLFAWLTESIEKSALMGALLAEIEERAPHMQAGQIEYEHAKLFAILRSRAIEEDQLGNGWNAFVFDVSYFCHRMSVNPEKFYGPLNDIRPR